jgi:hypothetical protein
MSTCLKLNDRSLMGTPRSALNCIRARRTPVSSLPGPRDGARSPYIGPDESCRVVMRPPGVNSTMLAELVAGVGILETDRPIASATKPIRRSLPPSIASENVRAAS